MNKMKQLIFVIFGFIVAALVTGLMLGSAKSDIQRQVEENSRESSIAAVSENHQREQEIVFFATYNYSGNEKISSGYLINKNGKKYDFDCDKEAYTNAEKLFSDKSAQMDSMEGTIALKESDVRTLCELVANIHTEDKYVLEKTEASRTESGIETVYAVVSANGETKLLKLFSRGDVSEILSDTSAKSFRKLFVRNFPQIAAIQ